MHRTLTRRVLTSTIAAALALGGLACGGDSNNNNNNNGTTPSVTSFTASKDSVASGEKVTLNWQVKDATTVSIVAAPGGALTTDSTMLTGSIDSAALTADTTFTLTAKDGAGKTANKSVTVTVTPGVTVTISSFSANPTTVAAGGSTTLSWTTSGATSVKINDGTSDIFTTDTAADVANGSHAVSNLTATKTFTLTAVNGTVTKTQSVTVTVQSVQTGEVEPNDDQNTATPVAGTITASIGASDVDWFSFTVEEGGWVKAETSDGNGGCNFDTVITLYDSTGTELGNNDDGGIPLADHSAACSKIDPARDSFASALPAGTYYIMVEGYTPQSGENATGEYTLTVVTGVPGCGNGVPEEGEQCDDGNQVNDDNCSNTCELVTLGPITGTGGSVNATIPAGEYRLILVTIATQGQSIKATTGDATGACPVDMDTTLELYGSDFSGLGQATDAANGDACAEIANSRDDFAHNLDAGDYYLLVANEGTASAAITVTVGIVEPGCGNEIVENDEQCDDGNTSSDDYCSSTCELHASATITSTGGVALLNVPANDFRLVMVTTTTASQSIRATTGDSTGACAMDMDTAIALYNVDPLQRLGVADTNVAGDPCAEIASARDSFANALPQGSYYLLVANQGTAAATIRVQVSIVSPGCGNDIIEAGETCDDGNVTAGDGCSASCQYEGAMVSETEVNNTSAAANASGATAGHTVLLSGAINPVGDVDFFAFDITGAPASVKIQTHSLPGNVDACTGATDTVIQLNDSMGNVLKEADDIDVQNNVLCSLIDGTGASPADAEAHLLPVGHYTVSIHAYNDASAIPAYFVSVTLE